MNTATLVRAIKRHDPDGNGIQRVKDAATKALNGTGKKIDTSGLPWRDDLIQRSDCNCVLAHAWRNGHWAKVNWDYMELLSKDGVELSPYVFSAKVNKVIKKIQGHKGKVVIRWFDSHNTSISEVVRLLEGVTDENYKEFLTK